MRPPAGRCTTLGTTPRSASWFRIWMRNRPPVAPGISKGVAAMSSADACSCPVSPAPTCDCPDIRSAPLRACAGGQRGAPGRGGRRGPGSQVCDLGTPDSGTASLGCPRNLMRVCRRHGSTGGADGGASESVWQPQDLARPPRRGRGASLLPAVRGGGAAVAGGGPVPGRGPPPRAGPAPGPRAGRRVRPPGGRAVHPRRRGGDAPRRPGGDRAGDADPVGRARRRPRRARRRGREPSGRSRPGLGRGRRRRPGAPAVPDLVLAAALPPHRLAAAVDEAAGGAGLPGLAAAVLDRDGIVVAASRAPPGGGAIGPETRDALRGRLALETNGVLHQDGRDGPAAVLAFARAPRSGYAAVLSAPAAAQAPAGAALGPLAGASVLVLLGGAAIAALLARRVRQEMGLLAAVGPEGPSAPAAASASLSGLRKVQELAEALSAAAAERDLATARLARSERRFRTLAEAGALVVWRGDAEGRIREAQGWQELTGQACGATQDGGWRGVLHPEDPG